MRNLFPIEILEDKWVAFVSFAVVNMILFIAYGFALTLGVLLAFRAVG